MSTLGYIKQLEVLSSLRKEALSNIRNMNNYKAFNKLSAGETAAINIIINKQCDDIAYLDIQIGFLQKKLLVLNG